MAEINIWEGLDFSKEREVTAFDLLKEQAKMLTKSTQGELTMEVDAHDGYMNEEMTILGAVYTLYVVVPKLGNFRKKILAVADYRDSVFPVDIVSAVDGRKESEISRDAFLEKVKEILSRPIVKNSIQHLYQQSKEIKSSFLSDQLDDDFPNKDKLTDV